MSKAHLSEYQNILESLEVPVNKLSKKSKITTETEIINDLRVRFSLPADLSTRDEISTYLSNNVTLEDFFVYLFWLVRPFVIMLLEIYEFLDAHCHTIDDSKSVFQLRIGNEVPLPIDLSHMPREWLRIITSIGMRIWDINALISINEDLYSAAHIASCDGVLNGELVCKRDCYDQCKSKCKEISEYLEDIIRADMLSVRILNKTEDNARDNSLYEFTSNEESQNQPGSLPSKLKENINYFLGAYKKSPILKINVLSDCIPMQKHHNPKELWSLILLDNILAILSGSYSSRRFQIESLKEFLKLPYWRQRNDLFEIWTLIKVCQRLPPSQVNISNISNDGTWHLPGNGQGDLSRPVLQINTDSNQLFVFTGVKLTNFRFPSEKKDKQVGAMPDWILCRKVPLFETFDYQLFFGEQANFADHNLIPEMIIECKAGASYALLDTLSNPMVNRYLPLLRTEKGKCYLLNYRPFSVPSEYTRFPILRKLTEQRYKNIVVIDDLAPGSKKVDEYEQSLDLFFREYIDSRISVLDIMFVMDTTGSMEKILPLLKRDIIDLVKILSTDKSNYRVGFIAIGDHDPKHPDPYCIKSLELTRNSNAFINFLYTLENTNGGDAPEAYEDALLYLHNAKWSESADKLVVFMGDSFPHDKTECPKRIDWEEQVRALSEMGVKVYGLQLDDKIPSESFFLEVCGATNGEYIHITNAGTNQVLAQLTKWLVP